MENQQTFAPIAIKYYFNLASFQTIKVMEVLDVFYNEAEANAYLTGYNLLMSKNPNQTDENGILTSYSTQTVVLDGHLTKEEVEAKIEPYKSDTWGADWQDMEEKGNSR